MFKNKPRKNRAEALRSSKLRLENLEERQLLTTVGAFDVPYGPDPAPVVCTAAPEVDNLPTVDLTSVAANSESELVLATTGTTRTVTTNADSGTGSLRAAISSASAGDTIKFNLPVDQRVITLNSILPIDKSLTIDASNLYENGTPGITIDGNKKGSVFNVVSKASVVINGLTITNGSAYAGGGICIGSGCYVETINTTISGNTASYQGGGVHVYGTYTSINTTISGNTASYQGGGVRVTGTYTSINTTISGNTASEYGGGVSVYTGATYTSTNTTISSGNTANKGGGVHLYKGATYTSTNTTISGNTASYGGGVYVWDSTYTAQNSIIVGNSATYADDEISGTVIAGDDSLTSGDKYAIFADYDKGDYSLKTDSPAIDAGNNKYVTGEGEESVLVETDRVGNYRIRQGKDGSSQTVDIGAYEFVNPNYPVTIEVTSFDDVVDPTDGVISFREAVQSANDGDTITFASSLQDETITLGSTLTINKSLTIDASNLLSEYGMPGITINGDKANRIFDVESGKTVELKYLALEEGKAGTDESPENGGAIYNNGILTLTEVAATSNSATKNGGAVFNASGATLTISGGNFSNNKAAWNGGAFANYGTMTIIEGGVWTQIIKNTASRFGGAYFGCGTLNITGNTRFEDNEVTANGSKGGAIYNDVNGTAGTVSITGTVEFIGNKAVERGGAIMSYSTKADPETPTLTVKGTTTFDGNEATQYGGAIDVGQGCAASLGGKLTFTNNNATSDEPGQGFGGAIFSVASLTFEDTGTYTFTGNTATKSGGAIDACDGTLNLAGDFTFNSNVASGDYAVDKTGLGGSIATAAVTTVTDGNFTWGDGNKAARGNCVALDSKISPKLSSESFGLKVGDDYSTFTVIRDSVKQNSVLVPSTFAPNAVVATITASGVSTTFGAEGVTPEQLGLDAGTHEALIQYADADGETSAVYSLVLTVDSAASLAVRETSFANDRGVKFDFNLTNADGRAVSVWEIAWGDGTTSRLEKLSTSWLAAHYYAQDGTFDVSLTVAYLDGTSETFEAFATQTIGAAPVATTGKADALACVFAEPEDLFDEFEELGNLIGPMPLR